MLKMSFYNGTLDKESAIQFIQQTQKPCVYTYGFEYKQPTTHRVPLSKEEAIRKINDASLLKIKEEREVIHLNAFSDNDMF